MPEATVQMSSDTSTESTTESRDVSASFTMYTTPWCGYCHRLKSQLDREGISYDIVDIEAQPEAAEIVESANNGNQTVPTLVYTDGTAQTNPSIIQIKEKLASLAGLMLPRSRLTTGRARGRRTSARPGSG